MIDDYSGPCANCGTVFRRRQVRTPGTMPRLHFCSRACLYAYSPAGKHNTVHGQAMVGARTKEHRVWTLMKGRCLNPKNPRFSDYGGRGITICDEWKDSFERFFSDMGPRPTGTSIDRIDNDGPYAPWNCRWANRRTQDLNRSVTRAVIVNGEPVPVADLAARIGMKKHTLDTRLRRGWTVEDAIAAPLARGARGFRKMDGDSQLAPRRLSRSNHGKSVVRLQAKELLPFTDERKSP